jgi:hypothetical protein
VNFLEKSFVSAIVAAMSAPNKYQSLLQKSGVGAATPLIPPPPKFVTPPRVASAFPELVKAHETYDDMMQAFVNKANVALNAALNPATP